RAQMRDIRDAGIDEVVSSWWGWGSPEDLRLPAVIKAAHRRGLRVAVQVEPYAGRSIATIASDLQHLRTLGIRDVYVYRAGDFTAAEWGVLNLRISGVRMFAQTNLAGFAAKSGFSGFYTYDVLLYGGNRFERYCAQAHAAGILCGPSVGPGYDATPATGDVRIKARDDGATYDCMWRAALAAHADFVTITSYNEWSEGTQIEPAGHGGRYESYDGAYGLYGRAAQRAYIRATARWTPAVGAGISSGRPRWARAARRDARAPHARRRRRPPRRPCTRTAPPPRGLCSTRSGRRSRAPRADDAVPHPRSPSSPRCATAAAPR